MSKPTVELLANLQADCQVLYQKLRTYHWNVTGPQFFSLHVAFEGLYQSMAGTIDEIAERIRGLDAQPPGTLKACLELTRLSEDAGVPDAMTMVKNLAADYETVGKSVKSLIETAEEAGDIATATMLEDLCQETEKTVWMLKSCAS